MWDNCIGRISVAIAAEDISDREDEEEDVLDMILLSEGNVSSVGDAVDSEIFSVGAEDV